MNAIKGAFVGFGRWLKNLWSKGWWGKLGAIVIVLFIIGIAQSGLIKVGLMDAPPTPVPTATVDAAAVAAKLTEGAAGKGTEQANEAATDEAKQAARANDAQTSEAEDAAEATKEASGAGVTLANFQKLETGMTYEQVVEILGDPGEELSRSDIAGYTTVMYSWNGEGGFGANMNAMFQNGKMVSKAQLGLR